MNIEQRASNNGTATKRGKTTALSRIAILMLPFTSNEFSAFKGN